MKSTTGQIYAIQSSNLYTQQITVEQERFTLEDAILRGSGVANAIVEIANNTEDAWFYEVVICLD